MPKKFCPNHPNNPLFAKNVCIVCYRNLYAKPLKKTPIKPISTRQQNVLIVYRMLRRKYLKEHPVCEIKLHHCSHQATQIHHTAKKYSERLWLDVKFFKACCDSCHRKIENSPTIAKHLGIYNLNKTDEENMFNNTTVDTDAVNTINGESEVNKDDSIY